MPAPPDEDVPQNFPDLPPFSSDVHTAPLLRLSLQQLIDGDGAERSRLWDACCNLGFFYLDLRGAKETLSRINGNGVDGANGATNGHQGDSNGTYKGTHRAQPNETPKDITHGVIDGDGLLSQSSALFAASSAFFSLPLATKQAYDFAAAGSYFGYKGYGGGVIDRHGTTDRNEFYNISKDDILGLSAPLPAPEELTPHRPLLRDFIVHSHAIVQLVLSELEKGLGVESGTLGKLHRLEEHSGDQVRWVQSPPQPEQDRRTALGAHTDFGSVTVLFNRLGGLQILPPGESYESAGMENTAPGQGKDSPAASSEGSAKPSEHDPWQYVRPLPGHCIVNLGDALVKFTRGVLRSNVHRVVNPPGEQAQLTRTSLVYFSRPVDEVMLRPLEGSRLIDERKTDGKVDDEVVSSKEWVLRRALGRRGRGDWNTSEGTETTSAPGVKV